MVDHLQEDPEFKWARDLLYDDSGLRSCGCGDLEDRMDFLRGALRAMPLHENEGWKAFSGPLGEWFLCLLDGAGLLEHGGVITSSWLTERGERLLKVLNNEDFFQELMV